MSRARLVKNHRVDAMERGAIAVLAALLLVMVLSVAALVVDYGMVLFVRTKMSKAVDAAALAGAQELPNQSSARTQANRFIALNVKDSSIPVPNVSFPATNVIRVEASENLDAMFSRVVGLNSFAIPAVAEATRYDPNVAIIIDRSGSMCEDTIHHVSSTCPAVGPWQPFSTVQQIAKGFVDQLTGNPKFTLISYSTTARLDVPLTTNRALIKSKIDALAPGGYTDIAASVNQSIDQLMLATGPEPKIVVLLTDGKTNTVNGRYLGDNNPQAVGALLDSSKTAQKKGVTIYGINYGLDVDNDIMRQVAETTEGTFYYAPDNPSLQVVYADIAEKAHIRLTYVH